MSSFIDKVKIHIKSGDGGNGIVAWRREKFVPQGGPAGGDGGKGGDVYVEATNDMNTLLEFKHKSIYKAEDGENGKNKNQHGKQGKDVLIKVPCGTIVRDVETGNAIADLTEAGQQVLVASGGRGGRGNARFTSSTRQAPQFSEPGEPGIERDVELELKLIADVGIIGMPNAGKSTLISVISAAKPKIADYPFTTLTPNLGVVKGPGDNSVIVADIPGLVEGASTGVGLGHEFLRHVERTRFLLHLVDIASASTAEDAIANYKMLNTELKKYSPKLAQKPQVLILPKIDAIPPEDVQVHVDAFNKLLKKKTPVFTISSVSRSGLDDVLARMFERLAELPQEEEVVELTTDWKAHDNDDSDYEIIKHGKRTFEAVGGKLQRLIGNTDMRNRVAVYRLMNIYKAMGVFTALAKAGAKEGDTIVISGIEFEYFEDED